ncbi:MAG: acyl carrier protein, partial [Verrucomicrobiota bacterium]
STTRQAIDWDRVTEASTIESLGFDSLTVLDLIYDIQQAFELEFEAEDMMEIRTIGQLGDFLQGRLA